MDDGIERTAGSAELPLTPSHIAAAIRVWWSSIAPTELLHDVASLLERFRTECLSRSRLDAANFATTAEASEAAALEWWHGRDCCVESVARTRHVDPAELSEGVDRKYERWLRKHRVPKIAVLPSIARSIARELVRCSARRRTAAVRKRPTGRWNVESFVDSGSPVGIDAVDPQSAVEPLLRLEQTEILRKWLLERPAVFVARLSQIDWSSRAGQRTTLLLDLRLDLLIALGDDHPLEALEGTDSGAEIPRDRVGIVEWWQPWTDSDLREHLCTNLPLQSAWQKACELHHRGITVKLRARLIELLNGEGFAIDSAAYRQRVSRAKQHVGASLATPEEVEDLLEPLRSARRAL